MKRIVILSLAVISILGIAIQCLATPAWSGVLIGNYRIDSRFNTAGCPPSYPDPYNPYVCPTQLPPGPVIIEGLAAGQYRTEVTGNGPNGPSGVRVWLGDSASGTSFWLPDVQIVGSTYEFPHPGGNIAMFWHDWYPYDNGFGYWTDVAATVTSPIPEPATLLLLASGLVGLAAFRKRFKG